MTNPRASLQNILPCLNELRACVGSPSYDASENELTLLAYAERLARYEPAVVRAACKRAAEEFTRWPPLKELLRVCDEERARLAEKSLRLPPPEADWWSAPGSVVGTGLLVASGQYLLRGFAPADARREFNRVVNALGFARAKQVADEAYNRGRDHHVTIAALYRALGEPAPGTPGWQPEKSEEVRDERSARCAGARLGHDEWLDVA